jgi:uncharacterized protein
MKRSLGILPLVMAALAAAGCGGGEAASPTDENLAVSRDALGKESVGGVPAPAEGTSAQGITVVGTGSLETVPDVSEWTFGVHSRAETAQAALRESSVETKRLLAVLKGAGIAKGDLRTEQVSLWPDMREGGTIVGYTASNSVHATIRRMEKAGAVVDAAVAAGANEVYGPSFSVSDTRARFDEAAAKAYDDAFRKAEALARRAGVTLGRPVAIAEVSGGNVYEGFVFNKAAASDVPVEPGKQEVQVSLTVTFAIS